MKTSFKRKEYDRGGYHEFKILVDVKRTGTVNVNQFRACVGSGTTYRVKSHVCAFGKNPRAATAAALTKLARSIRAGRAQGAFEGRR